MTNIIDYIPRIIETSYSRKNYDSKKADDAVFYCKSCKNCWEEVNTSSKNTQVYFYKNFPTYGKKRKTCGECKGESLILRKNTGMPFYEIQNSA